MTLASWLHHLGHRLHRNMSSKLKTLTRHQQGYDCTLKQRKPHTHYKDYVCRENSQQIAVINYLFSVNFHSSIFSLLDICHENWCTERHIY